MNFSSDSVKLKSKPQNEDFYFDIETPRGHFFAVLDFAPHDYANLNATLKGKLETIVGSFVSLSRFSADLFLGFLAKEINNFLHNLGEQSGGPELLCSAALCIVSGNRLNYFLSSDVSMNIVSSGRLLPLNGQRVDASVLGGRKPVAEQAGNQLQQLGAHDQEGPLTDRVQAFTLQDDDVVLIMTRGLVEAFKGAQLTNEILNLRSPDPKVISDTLMNAGESSRDDRTLVVITGPYERYVDPVLSDLSKAVASLEARVNSLTERDQRERPDGTDHLEKAPGTGAEAQLEQRFGQQMEIVKDDLRGKAARIDLLEVDEKLKNLNVVLASKADTAQVMTLQRDILKLGLMAKGVRLPGENETGEATPTATSESSAIQEAESGTVAVRSEVGRRPYGLPALLLISVIAIAAGFFGGWLQSRVAKRNPEVWSVKTAGNQISISRLDAGGGQGGVSLNVAQPLKANGEQTFSSFNDVKQYVDTLTSNQTLSEQQSAASQPKEEPTPVVTEVAVGPGDTLDRIARRNNITADRLKELNPQITNWRVLKVGQRVMVPMAPSG